MIMFLDFVFKVSDQRISFQDALSTWAPTVTSEWGHAVVHEDCIPAFQKVYWWPYCI